MNFLKETKGKVIAGVVAVGIISGASFAFANTDAGQALKGWYDNLFEQKTEAAANEVDQYREGLKPELMEEYAGEKAHADGIIDRKRKYEVEKSTDMIENAKASHLESLGSKKNEILLGMERDFYDAFVVGVQEINRLGEEAREYVRSDLNSHFANKGEETLSQMEEELGAVKERAVTELEDAVENAQAEIEAEVNKGSDMLVHNLTNLVDHKVEELRRNVREIVDRFVKEQEKAIVTKATELENDAKQALDDVVSGI
ncbi:hypothetical protein FHP05_07755 [Cerasibacillus terrae]|uniref:Uncharacterized protein n=1 Tax=Cerasibacillus terrae TaxID=2498845 RepID=A0A5C8NV17_9BACI|nr:hypothetical protein [Cerasibacillus terrae]TXL65025.1 hypothetical protein FHP05_07755 [Cerasibacillus terrae]